MNFSINELMRMKKKDLVLLIGNLSRERDESIDELSNAREELSEVETYEDEFYQLEELKGLIENYKIANEREYLGVATAREDKEKYLDKILDFAN